MFKRVLAGLIVFNFALSASAADEVSTEPSRVRVFERSADRVATGTVRMFEESIHIPLKLLIDEFGLERKPLGENRVGICRGDLCIPFDVADKDGALRRDGTTLWVPVAPLVEALGGHFVWDVKARSLLLDLSDVDRAATWKVGEPFELQLPNLEGQRVNIERYRGRKVLIFAWASW